MSVNGVTSATDAYSTYAATQPKAKEVEPEKKEAQAPASEAAAVYEPGDSKASQKTYVQNTDLVNKLKFDAEERTANLRNIVEKLISGQSTAFANANDMWRFLAKGDFTVDAATKAQAQEDISEDGYWGVKQTSDRIIDFATALTGGDPDQIEKMRDAFKKGYEQAEKIWGGELPEISKQTYDAVMKKFDELAEAAGLSTQA